MSSPHPNYTKQYFNLVLPLGFLTLGIFLGKILNISLIYLISLLVISFSLLIIMKSNELIKQLTLLIMFLIGGSILFSLKNKEFMYLRETLCNKKLNLECEIISKKAVNQSIFKEVITFTATDKQSESKFNFLCLSIEPTNLVIGDFISIDKIKINFKENFKNYDRPTFKEYLIKEQLLGSYFCKKLNYKKIESKNLISTWINKVRNNLLTKFRNKLKHNTYLLFSLMFLGNKNEIPDDSIKETFSFWGLLHYLARSGLHVVIFIFFWKLFLGYAPLPAHFKEIILIVISIIYFLLSFSSLSFNRAFFVFLLYEVSKLCGKKVNFLPLLTLVCILMVLYNPFIVLFLDFQLSFGLTFALSILNSNLKT